MPPQPGQDPGGFLSGLMGVIGPRLEEKHKEALALKAQEKDATFKAYLGAWKDTLSKKGELEAKQNRTPEEEQQLQEYTRLADSYHTQMGKLSKESKPLGEMFGKVGEFVKKLGQKNQQSQQQPSPKNQLQAPQAPGAQPPAQQPPATAPQAPAKQTGPLQALPSPAQQGGAPGSQPLQGIPAAQPQAAKPLQGIPPAQPQAAKPLQAIPNPQSQPPQAAQPKQSADPLASAMASNAASAEEQQKKEAEAKEREAEVAETFRTNEADRLERAKLRARQEAKDAEEKKKDDAAQAAALLLGPEDGEAFLKMYRNKKLLGTPNPTADAPGEDVKNIPGSAVKGKQDAFGNPVDEKGVYTKGKDGKLYPETPAPKAEPPETAEIRERAKAYMDKNPQMSEADAMKQARSDWVKEQNEKATKVTVQVSNELRKDAPPEKIKPGSGEYRIAQDLGYGKLTFQQFRTMLSTRSSGPSDANQKKISIYDLACQLNPNFNPELFEMGYKLASNPKVQQQLSSLDNVRSGVDDLLKFSEAATRTGSPLLNKAVIPGGINIGNHHYSDFKTARVAFADELSGALGYGSATDMSREMGKDMTDPNLSPEAFQSAIQDVVIPFVERKKKALLDQMGIYGQPGMNPAAGGPASNKPLTGPGELKAPGSDGMVTMKLKDGRTGKIHRSQIENFTNANPGATEVK